MAKVTAEDIKNMGITPAMFLKDDTTIDAYIDLFIQEQSIILEAELGDKYLSSDFEVDEAAKLAEKYRVLAEMIDTRINFFFDGDKDVPDEMISSLIKTAERYRNKAEKMINKILYGFGSDDFASDIVISGEESASSYNK